MKTPLRFWKDEAGQSIPEYGLILALMAIALMLVLLAFRDELGAVFNRLSGRMEADGRPIMVEAN